MAGQLGGTGKAFVGEGDAEGIEGKPCAQDIPPLGSERVIARGEVEVRCVNDLVKMRQQHVRPNPQRGLCVCMTACKDDRRLL